MSTRVVYIAHPLAGDIAGNAARARRWIGWVYRQHSDVAVVAQWLVDLEVLAEDDGNPDVRERALARCEAVARLCDEVWLVGGRVTAGMAREAAVARVTRDLTDLGTEPPEGVA